MAPCKSAGRELSFEWSHHRISSTDSKVRVTLQNSIKHSGSERVESYLSNKKIYQSRRPDGTFFEPWMCLNSSPWWSNPESYPQLTNWWLEFVYTLLEDVMDCSRYVKLQEHLWQCLASKMFGCGRNPAFFTEVDTLYILSYSVPF